MLGIDIDYCLQWIFTYAKAKDFAKEETTFYDLAKLFREHSFATHIIALVCVCLILFEHA